MNPKVSFAPWQFASLWNHFVHFIMYGGVACVRGDTKILTENGKIRIDKLKEGTLVWAMGEKGPVLVPCGRPFEKGKTHLYRIVHEAGEFVAHGSHLISSSNGEYQRVEDLFEGEEILSFSESQHRSSLVDQKQSQKDALNCFQKNEDYSNCYQADIHSNDQPPLFSPDIYSKAFPSTFYGLSHSHPLNNSVEGNGLINSHPSQFSFLLSRMDSYVPCLAREKVLEGFLEAELSEQILHSTHKGEQFQKKTDCQKINVESCIGREFSSSPCSYSVGKSTILKIEKQEKIESYWDMEIPIHHNYLSEGAIHHNTGKTFTGAHFAIYNIINHPDLSGFIGSNTYDQLAQVSLRELMYWLDAYGFPWVIDCIPPAEWGGKKKLKSYRNVLSVFYRGQIVTIFTRVLSDGNPLRGIEFSWYWIDETRDTPENTHDIIIARMREDEYMKGLVTTTTNGEDWTFKRFVRGNNGDSTYGSMHVKSIDAVNIGIITAKYYNIMLRSYSTLMAEQELNAAHVNVKGGRAYYGAGEYNKMGVAPWGDAHPNPDRPLVVGCDFNFSPAPHIWMVGQIGPDMWMDKIHWFGELCEVEASTPYMAKKLLIQYPGFFYQIFGDATGNQGTTSNAGITDFNQIANTLSDAHCVFTIDVDQYNPLVRDRVENMNGMFLNSLGESRQTYSPQGCPNFDADLRVVGWKQQVQAGRGKLDNSGDVQRTHATDGAGYAVWKKFPPVRRGRIIESVPSTILTGMS